MPRFTEFDLGDPIQKVLSEVGYEAPFPIQAQIIPHLLAGRDVLGQAQTGTGKTAAFALPLLARLDLARREPQVLVLTPTRELAIQVAESFQKYAAHLEGFKVLAVYGGQEYAGQLRSLDRGVHVIVGTPGRVMDHLDRGTLDPGSLACLVLDEADEMLQMGFKEDVEYILGGLPAGLQIALFSATIPAPIRELSRRYLKTPAEIFIKSRTSTVEATRQRYWLISGMAKLDALSRILEAEPSDGVLVFVRTRLGAMDLAEKLVARGFAAGGLSGEMVQSQRERTVDQFKRGKLNIIVATDVAARGLDVDRISHVINYDMPYDPEAYIHRIGRTGRAGRSGEAILFVAPREQGMLRVIEKATRQRLSAMTLPPVAAINDKRILAFQDRITKTLAQGDLHPFRDLVDQYAQEHGVAHLDIAAALGRLLQGDTPLLLADRPERAPTTGRQGKPWTNGPTGRTQRTGRREQGDRPPRPSRPARSTPAEPLAHPGHDEATGRTAEADHPADSDRPTATDHSGETDRHADIDRITLSGRTPPAEHPTKVEHPTKAEHSAKAEHPTRAKHPTRAEHPASAGHTPYAKHPAEAEHVAGSEHAADAEHTGKARHAADAEYPGKARHAADVEYPGKARHAADVEYPGKAEQTATGERTKRFDRPAGSGHTGRTAHPAGTGRPGRPARHGRGPKARHPGDEGKSRFRIEVGRFHGVQPGNIVGAIANETGLSSQDIGKIKLYPAFSTVDLPADLPAHLLKKLAGVRVAGQFLRISPDDGRPTPRPHPDPADGNAPPRAPGFRRRSSPAPHDTPPPTRPASRWSGSSSARTGTTTPRRRQKPVSD